MEKIDLYDNVEKMIVDLISNNQKIILYENILKHTTIKTLDQAMQLFESNLYMHIVEFITEIAMSKKFIKINDNQEIETISDAEQLHIILINNYNIYIRIDKLKTITDYIKENL